MKKTVFAISSLAGVILLLNGCKTAAPSASAKTTSATATVSASATNTTDTASSTNLLDTDKARESYAVGMYMGHGWKTHGVDLDIDLVKRGIEDEESSNGPALLTEAQMREALNELQATVRQYSQKMQMQEQQMHAEEGKTNLTEGTAFLADNKMKPGVVTLPDGLQYKIVKDGTGAFPGPNDVVTVNYRGTYVDGTEFDSSAKSGHPIQFPVRAVIPGWTEGLEKMKVGSKWNLYIPSDLAYGPAGRGPIGPNKTLVFDVELLSVSHQAAPTPPPAAQPLTSDIIKVPSAQEMKNGAQIETIKASDLPKIQQQQSATNQ
jgi:FKBP-type peptidyl-prolyl cis-trans isomerase FklB